jgi:hypothetical protein
LISNLEDQGSGYDRVRRIADDVKELIVVLDNEYNIRHVLTFVKERKEKICLDDTICNMENEGQNTKELLIFMIVMN